VGAWVVGPGHLHDGRQLRQGIVTSKSRRRRPTGCGSDPRDVASFADVGVGAQVQGLGTLSRGALAATAVAIVAARSRDRHVLNGIATGAPAAQPCRAAFTRRPGPDIVKLTSRASASGPFTDASSRPPRRRAFAGRLCRQPGRRFWHLSSGCAGSNLGDDRAGPGAGTVASVTVGNHEQTAGPVAQGSGVSFHAGGFWAFGAAATTRFVTAVDVTSRRPSRTPPSTPTSASFAYVCVR